MLKIKKQEIEKFVNLTHKTDFFRDSEIEFLKTILDEYHEAPGKDYLIFKKEVDAELRGFVIFSDIPGTEFSWDIYWVVVEKSYQRQGIGKQLVGMVEEYVLSQKNKAILRIETSGKEKYLKTRNFYQRQGFLETGKIPDFYAPGDDLIIFTKHISKNPQ